MIELNVSLASNGTVKIPGYEQLLRFGYTKNRGVYRILVSASGEWAGLAIRAFWHVPGGSDPASSLVVDGAVDVPASVTAQSGSGRITFEGSDGVKTVTSADLQYRVSANSGTDDGTLPEPGTPAWEALVSVVKDNADAAQQAKLDAQNAAKQADTSAEKAETAQKAAEQAGTQAVEAIGTAKGDALTAISTSRQDALDAVQQAQTTATKAVTDTKTTAVTAVQTAQSTATKAVQAAQSTATSAVQRAGADTLASIPADYTDTLGRVSALESCGFVVSGGKVCMKYRKS